MFRNAFNISINLNRSDKWPTEKLAEATIRFLDGPLDGCVLSGFTIWRSRDGGANVTFPDRSYTKNGQKERYELLRPTDRTARETVTRFIVTEYERHLAEQANAAAMQVASN